MTFFFFFWITFVSTSLKKAVTDPLQTKRTWTTHVCTTRHRTRTPNQNPELKKNILLEDNNVFRDLDSVSLHLKPLNSCLGHHCSWPRGIKRSSQCVQHEDPTVHSLPKGTQSVGGWMKKKHFTHHLPQEEKPTGVEGDRNQTGREWSERRTQSQGGRRSREPQHWGSFRFQPVGLSGWGRKKK